MSPAEKFISALPWSKRTGPRRWIARCPAHDDKSPSLTVSERDDGVVLVHCFGGCATEEVVDAIGLEMKHLFPEKLKRLPFWRPVHAEDALKAVAHEMTVVFIAASDFVRDARSMTSDTRDRVLLSCVRLNEAVRLATGSPIEGAVRIIEDARLRPQEIADLDALAAGEVVWS